jgi:uncharacterized RDD family membrane protein YckC
MNLREETKNYVTPYAFGVSDELLGKALASPLRRLCALLIDLIVVATLTLMSINVFTFVVFIVSVIGYFKSKARKNGGMAQTAFVAAAIVSVIIISGSLLVDNLDFGFGKSDTVVSVESELKQETISEQTKPEKAFSFIGYTKALLSDMGLGFGWAAVYFSVFVAWFNGQTIGKMLFRIRVFKINASPINFWESFGRYGGYSAGIATGLLGFLQIYWDPNRQAIHDKISETVVVDLRKADKLSKA